MAKKWIVGIDEVGRGCLAGPVVVAAALLSQGKKIKHKKLGKIRDSKKLTKLAREEWNRHLKERGVVFKVARVWPKVIDRINIAKAANLAALRAFSRLSLDSNLGARNLTVYLDGGLFLGSKEAQPVFAKTVIKGDQKIPVIAAASIFAKVNRDKLMAKLALKYPNYSLEIHKGYGTKAHIKAIKKHGLSKIHRRSFTKNIKLT